MDRTAAAREHVRGLVDRLGVPAAARALGLTPDALARVMAGLVSRPTTIARVLEHRERTSDEVGP